MSEYKGEAYCTKCKDKVSFEGQIEEVNGRRFAKGKCPACGSKLTRILGRVETTTKVYICDEYIDYEGGMQDFQVFTDEALAKKYCNDKNAEIREIMRQDKIKGKPGSVWSYTEVEVRSK